MHITPNNKLASFGTIGLLFLAGIAGMVFLLPASPAHAAGATVTLSTISSGVQTAATSGTVASSLVITGSGFLSNKPIEITSTVGTTTITWFTGSGANAPNTCSAAFTGNYGGVGTKNSLYVGYGGSNCLTTTAIGNFQVTVTVPAIPGGAQTIVVSDGTTTVSVPYTITPKISYATTSTQNWGFPEQSLAGSVISATGFGSGESITFSTTAFTTGSFAGATSCTTGTTPGGSAITGAGSCQTTSATFVVADTTGGAKTITATGATSSLSASTTYTVNPWIAFYNTQAGVTSFSFVGTAPTSLLIEAHGLPAGTLAGSSATVGGVATNHASVVIGTSGSFGGAGAFLVVSPNTNVPFGPVSVLLDGTTFSYAAGNIASGFAAGATTFGGVLISSVIGITATSTGVVSLDQANYKPGSVSTASKTSPAPIQNQIGFFGYGFVPAGGALSIATPAGAAFCTNTACTATGGTPSFFTGYLGGAGHGDNNGAFFATAILADTPWSATATPTVAQSYTATVAQAGGAPANILSPSFGITPWIDTTTNGITPTTVDYTTSTFTAKVHGFGATDVVTLSIGNTPMVSGGTCTTNTGGFGPGGCPSAVAQVPDLGAGKQNVLATGSVTGATVTATGAVTYDPNVDQTTGGTALNQVAGTGGSSTILRTGSATSGPAYGVHGLTASTAYSIVWNAISGSTVIGTFTSTATGGIPVPGVQVTIPADISGIHVLDIQASSTLGTSAIYSNTLFSAPSEFADSDSGIGGTFTTQFGDLLFLEGATLVATPTVTNVGVSTVISGNGLAASTLYDLGMSIAGNGLATTPSTCSLSGTLPALPPTTIVGSFTSTSTGAVPSAQSVALTDMASYQGGEQGTLFCIFAQTGPNFGSTTAVGVAEFELQANLNLNMTSAPIGHNVIATAHGLATNAAYNIIFAYQPGVFAGYTGTVVGAILSNTVGAGSATFTVPSVAAGSYTIELVNIAHSNIAIATAPTLSVTTSGGNCSNQGTTCMSVTGTPTVQTIGGGTKGIVATYTDNSNTAQTAIVFAVVHNAAGQTVYYTTATISPAANGGSAVAQLVLFGLPSGSYTATLFATSTGGTAISGTTTVSVTL